MKKRQLHKVITIVLAVALMLSLSVNVFGAGHLISIEAYLNNGIRVMLHGEPFEPIDPVDNTKYVPITYKGRTYLPLAAVAEAVGLEVTWDANTNTAYLGDVSGEIAKDQVSWIRVSPEYTPGSEADYRLQSRQPEYLNRAPDRSFEYGYAIHPDYGAGISLRVDTNYEYDTFKATFWLDDTEIDDSGYVYSPEIEFTDEYGSQVKYIKEGLEWQQLVDVELDVKDVKHLYIWVRGSLSIIGEPMLSK